MIKCGKCGSTQFNLIMYPQGNELCIDINTFNNTVNIQYELDTEKEDFESPLYCKTCGERVFGTIKSEINELVKGRYTLYGNKNEYKKISGILIPLIF